MMKSIQTTLFASILLTSLSPVMALASDLGFPSKTEVELKLNLTQTGFNKLKAVFLKSFKGEESSRSDYYFDIFKNDSYVLKSAQPAVKLRFQDNGDSLTWQTQRSLSSSTLAIFSAKKTESISMDIPRDQALIDSVKSYHSKLEIQDPYALTIAKATQSTLETKGIIAFTQSLCPQCLSSERYFSTHMNTKKRVKIKLKLNEDQFSVQVGETINRGVSTYELEAEVKKSSDLNKSATTLQNWLNAQGLESVHIEDSVSADQTKFSEELLKAIF